MALEFRLPNGGLQHMTMINTPMFFAAMPRTFLDKMLALKPDPAMSIFCCDAGASGGPILPSRIHSAISSAFHGTCTLGSVDGAMLR